MSSITTDLVSCLHIEHNCKEAIPCQHECIIFLSDGREKKVRLPANEIYLLINEIGVNKILCSDKVEHFAPNPNLALMSNHEQRSAPDILTSIFSSDS